MAGIRSRIQTIAVPSEIGDFADEVRRVFLELGRVFGGGDALAGECVPTLDVYETDDALELAVDVPGVSADAVRVLSKGDTILIVGEKAPRRTRRDATFHLVERGYGRFARVVRLAHACDMSNARGTITDGELRISIPKIAERRGRTISVPIS
jgi:HSP20 family protein